MRYDYFLVSLIVCEIVYIGCMAWWLLRLRREIHRLTEHKRTRIRQIRAMRYIMGQSERNRSQSHDKA